jgi:hypothetical protein
VGGAAMPGSCTSTTTRRCWCTRALASTPEGATDYLHADLREPGDVLAGAARTLDFSRPVAVTILGVLWHILDDDEARRIIGG